LYYKNILRIAGDIQQDMVTFFFLRCLKDVSDIVQYYVIHALD